MHAQAITATPMVANQNLPYAQRLIEAHAMYAGNDVRLAFDERYGEASRVTEIGPEGITGHGLRAFAIEMDGVRTRVFAADDGIAQLLRDMGKALIEGEVTSAIVTCRSLGKTAEGVPAFFAFVTEAY